MMQFTYFSSKTCLSVKYVNRASRSEPAPVTPVPASSPTPPGVSAPH